MLKPNRAQLLASLTLPASIPKHCLGFTSASGCPKLITRGPPIGTKNIIHASTRSYQTSSSQLKMENDSTKIDSGLYLFDFDGVICDSCDECTVSAWRTCHILNAIKGDNTQSTDNPPQWLFDKMREIRPAIEVGWQIPVLLSVFLEQQYASTPEKPAMTIPEILSNYESLVQTWLAQHNLTDEDMVRTFGKVRDDWIANDLSSWLDINVFYNGIAKAISECTGETVLVTTKQQRFATALVRHAGVSEDSMPDESIYGLGMYKSKADVIVDKMTQRKIAPENTHFFEDRWPTIAKCLKDERLDGVQFYLCSWGYCTEEEIKLANKESSRVKVLSLADFSRVVV